MKFTESFALVGKRSVYREEIKSSEEISEEDKIRQYEIRDSRARFLLHLILGYLPQAVQSDSEEQ